MQEDLLTREIINEQLEKLPSKIKAFVSEGDIRGKVDEFASLRGLSTQTAREIENEVVLVFLGLEDKTDLLSNIQENVDIKEDDAQSLSTKIKQTLFDPLESDFRELKAHQDAEEDLMKRQNENSETTEEIENENPESLDRESILNEIENPSPGNARHEKMGPSDTHKVSEQKNKGGSGAINDPYRESI